MEPKLVFREIPSSIEHVPTVFLTHEEAEALRAIHGPGIFESIMSNLRASLSDSSRRPLPPPTPAKIKTLRVTYDDGNFLDLEVVELGAGEQVALPPATPTEG